MVEPFGDQTPYGDPTWYSGVNSAYFRESHAELAKRTRKFVSQDLVPLIARAEENHGGDEQQLLRKKMFEAGLLPFVVGSPYWPDGYDLGPCPVDQPNIFHELVIHDEIARASCGGLGVFGLFGGMFIGLPPVLKHGKNPVHKIACGQVMRGEKSMSVAITEPYAGSDVAGLKTTAKLTADGKHYLVSGEKKWITGGCVADYFSTAVRTGGWGAGGISILLIERARGVETRQMELQGTLSASTAYVTFDDVKVPAENIVGEVDAGFAALMMNFNHERWVMAVHYTRFARVCYEASFAFVHSQTSGKWAISQEVLRQKLAEMVRHVEATQAWLEAVTFQMHTASSPSASEENAKALGGTCALLKVQATKTCELCAREASQIFGGSSYNRGGVGEKIERIYREVRAGAIAGGSEEIMLDLGMKQAMRRYTPPVKQATANGSDAKL